MKEQDDKLVDRIRTGDMGAFRQIVERYQAQVVGTVVGIIGMVPEVDDVVQEVFISLYRSVDKFEKRASLKTYVTRIAVNGSLDHLRVRKRKVDRETSLEQLGDIGFAGNTGNEYNEDHELVWNAINALPDKYRPVVVLRMIEGYSTQEAADILGVRYGTILSRLSRALDRMRGHLGPYFETPERQQNA